MYDHFNNPTRSPQIRSDEEPRTSSPRALQRRALAGLDYASQLAAVRPPADPQPPLQFQSVRERRGEGSEPDDRSTAGVALDALGDVGGTLTDTIDAGRVAREALDVVRFELLVRGHGPLSRQVERMMDELKSPMRHLLNTGRP